MEAKTNYTLVGVVVLILITGLLTAALWLSIGFDKKKHNVYAVYIREAVSGLSEESAVKYNGVQVGNVYKIELSKSDPQEVKILLNIVAGTPITTSTYATLISQGITGTTFVGLSAASSDLTPLRRLPNEQYPIIPTKPSLFLQLDGVLKEISTNVNNVSMRLKEILDQENIANVKKSLSSIQIFTQTIAAQSDHITQGLKNSDIMIRNLAKVSNDLPQVINELKNSINKLTREMGQAGQNVSLTMEAGKTAIDKLSQQAIPSAVILINRLNKVALNIEKVSSQMSQNPAVIIRGTTPPTNGPGE